MVDRRKAFSHISSRDHCQRSSPSRISHTPRAGFEPAQNLNSGLVEWGCAVVITTTPRRVITPNCHNSSTSDDIYMKPWPVTKTDKRNKTLSKKIDDNVTSENCDVIVIFPISDQFGAIWKPDSERIVCKTYIFINSNLLSYKNLKQNWKSSNTALTLLLCVKILFLLKNSDISKIKRTLVLKGIFSETTCVRVLTYHISSF